MYCTDRICAAFALAALVHENQKRKSTEIPYISHPMAVASQVAVWGGSEDQFVAALLHDVIEDGGAQYIPVIEEHFGKHVLELVKACSDAAPASGQAKAPWLERKKQYLEHLRAASDEVLLISAADKWHNLLCTLADAKHLGDAVFDRLSTRKRTAPKNASSSCGTTRSLLPSIESVSYLLRTKSNPCSINST